MAKKSAKQRNTLSFFLLKIKPNVKFLVVISASWQIFVCLYGISKEKHNLQTYKSPWKSKNHYVLGKKFYLKKQHLYNCFRDLSIPLTFMHGAMVHKQLHTDKTVPRNYLLKLRVSPSIPNLISYGFHLILQWTLLSLLSLNWI